MRIIWSLAIVVLIAVLIAGCASTTSPLPSGPVQVRVIYDGEWHGAYGTIGTHKSVEGTGPATFTIDQPKTTVTGTFQKTDGGPGELKVEIVRGSEILQSEFTTASYGVVSISARV